jgi:hypothetical protein
MSDGREQVVRIGMRYEVDRRYLSEVLEMDDGVLDELLRVGLELLAGLGLVVVLGVVVLVVLGVVGLAVLCLLGVVLGLLLDAPLLREILPGW